MSNLSEEEKKAIELLKGLCSDDCINKDIVDTIVSLIEKQQKEIEELKKGNKSLMDSRKKWKERYYKEKGKNKLVETYKSYMLPENVEFVIIQKKELEELKDIEADYIRRTESSNKVLLEQGYIRKDEIRKIMASNTELSAYHKIKELLEEK